MSLKRRLESLTAGLGDEAPPPATPPPLTARAPRTAPGQLMAFREHMVHTNEQLVDLQRRLAEFEGATPAQQIDGARIRPSVFANRHPDQFKTAAFDTLKRDIQGTAGNVEAILVRPIKDALPFEYEVVFGHRRHRACLELGIPVLALIREVNDEELWLAMFQENLDREDLSPYETGVMYQTALARGLFEKQDRLAAAIRRSKAHITMALQVAGLPAEILAAFDSPIQIQYRWAAELHRQLAADRGRLLERAEELGAAKAAGQRRLSAGQVFDSLVRAPQAKRAEIRIGGKVAATITSRGGAIAVSIAKGRVAPSRVAELRKVLSAFLSAGDGPGETDERP